MFISFFALVITSRTLDITDLGRILKQLELFPKDKWHDFGLMAGLYAPTLSTIRDTHRGNSEECFKRCLSLWLERADNVDGKGKPTWQRLAKILEEMGNKALADEIRIGKGQNNNVLCIILVELVIRNISEDGSSMSHGVMIYCILSVSITVWLCELNFPYLQVLPTSLWNHLLLLLN